MLKRGDSGDDVRVLQQGLVCYGAMTGGVDGSYGPATENAVKKVQEAEGLAVDGVAWPQTRGYLNHLFGEWEIVSELSDFSMGLKTRICQRCGFVEKVEEWPSPLYRRGDKGDGVKALQEALNDSGYNCGTADGDFGGRTESAVSNFEAANGIQPDGIAWPGVISLLGAKNAEAPEAVDAGSDYRKLTLTMAVSGGKSADEAFKVGEVVPVTVTVSNPNDIPVPVEYLRGFPYLSGDYQTLAENFTLEAHGSHSETYSYTITAKDGAREKARLRSQVMPAEGLGLKKTNSEVLVIRATHSDDTQNFVIKNEIKDGGVYFYEGQNVTYVVTVTNPNDFPIQNANVRYYMLDSSAIAGMSALTEVNLPDTLEYIGMSNFTDCNALTEVVIPPRVLFIGQDCFVWVDGLESVTFTGPAPYISGEAFRYLPDGFTFFVPDDQLEAYAAALPEGVGIQPSGQSAVVTDAETPASEFEFDPETGTITGWSGEAPRVTVPAEIGGVAVTAIGSRAFRDKDLPCRCRCATRPIW